MDDQEPGCVGTEFVQVSPIEPSAMQRIPADNDLRLVPSGSGASMPEKPAAIAPLRILIVDDEVTIQVTLSACLEADGHHVRAHGNPHDALADAAVHAFDLIFLDVRLGTENGLDYIQPLLAFNPWAKIVVITAYASIDTAVEAMKRGAADYLAKPFSPSQVELVTASVAERRRLELQVQSLQSALGDDPEADFISTSSAMQRTMEMARQVAASNAPVLISGEIGTGKGRLARKIHAWSLRSRKPPTPSHPA